MRGAKAKRLRRAGLKAGPAYRARPIENRLSGHNGWKRTSSKPLVPNADRQARAERKRGRS